MDPSSFVGGLVYQVLCLGWVGWFIMSRVGVGERAHQVFSVGLEGGFTHKYSIKHVIFQTDNGWVRERMDFEKYIPLWIYIS